MLQFKSYDPKVSAPETSKLLPMKTCPMVALGFETIAEIACKQFSGALNMEG